MQLKSSFLVLGAMLAALSSMAEAAPAPEAAPIPGPSLKSRDATGHIYICTEGGFAGECDDFAVTNGVCTNFPSGFNDQISSWGPDQGWLCVTYTADDCTGETYTGTYPGFSSLPSGIDNELSSVICYQE